MSPSPILLIADPKVLAIPIHECHEPLINLQGQSEILFGPSPEIENNQDYTYLRLSIYKKLLEAQKQLPQNLQLCVYEGLRTFKLQKYLFQERWEKIQLQHPQWDRHALYEEVIKMVSPTMTLDGIPNIPPHTTGAAVDLYLIDSHHQPVDMGLLAKDWLEDLDGQLSKTFSTVISKTAQQNRAILFDVMQAVGFINYPTEYWHWSYGDRYWACVTGEPYAFYGPMHS